MAMHTLFYTNEKDGVLYVQEPWFNPIRTARRLDKKIQGKDVLFVLRNPCGN